MSKNDTNVVTGFHNDDDDDDSDLKKQRQQQYDNNNLGKDDSHKKKNRKTTTKKFITLISRDDLSYNIPISAAMHSIFIKDSLGLEEEDNEDHNHNKSNNTNRHNTIDGNDSIIDDANNNNNNNNNDTNDDDDFVISYYEPVNVLRVNGICLQKVIEFLIYYDEQEPLNEIPKPLNGDNFHEIIKQSYYRNFIPNCLQTCYNDNNQNQNHTNANVDGDDNNDQGTNRIIQQQLQEHYLHHHQQQQQSLSSSPSNNNNPNRIVFELMAASNYMMIKPLLELISLWITFQLQGKDVEQIRMFLNLPQVTPEEEARAREEHPWIFEEKSS